MLDEVRQPGQDGKTAAQPARQVFWFDKGSGPVVVVVARNMTTSHLARAPPKSAPIVGPTRSCESGDCLVGSKVVARPLCASPPDFPVSQQSTWPSLPGGTRALLYAATPWRQVCRRPYYCCVHMCWFPIPFTDLRDSGCRATSTPRTGIVFPQHPYPPSTIFISRRER